MDSTTLSSPFIQRDMRQITKRGTHSVDATILSRLVKTRNETMTEHRSEHRTLQTTPPQSSKETANSPRQIAIAA
jgi:hypothetical protein